MQYRNGIHLSRTRHLASIISVRYPHRIHLSPSQHTQLMCDITIQSICLLHTCNLFVPESTHATHLRHRYGIHLSRTRHLAAIPPYGVATTSSLLKIIGLFYKRAVYKRRYSSKETYNFELDVSTWRQIISMGWLRLVGSLKL